jgi:hypothetical protein
VRCSYGYGCPFGRAPGALSFGPESRNPAVVARFGRVVQCDGGEGAEGLLR